MILHHGKQKATPPQAKIMESTAYSHPGRQQEESQKVLRGSSLWPTRCRPLRSDCRRPSSCPTERPTCHLCQRVPTLARGHLQLCLHPESLVGYSRRRSGSAIRRYDAVSGESQLTRAIRAMDVHNRPHERPTSVLLERGHGSTALGRLGLATD